MNSTSKRSSQESNPNARWRVQQSIPSLAQTGFSTPRREQPSRRSDCTNTVRALVRDSTHKSKPSMHRFMHHKPNVRTGSASAWENDINPPSHHDTRIYYLSTIPVDPCNRKYYNPGGSNPWNTTILVYRQSTMCAISLSMLSSKNMCRVPSSSCCLTTLEPSHAIQGTRMTSVRWNQWWSWRRGCAGGGDVQRARARVLVLKMWC